ncbi:MAG: hypothetical protein PVH61_20905 [Candidatus Aminicenantes bacterium]|jgi:hypothetical protein
MKVFGTTIKETIDAFKPVHLGKKSKKKNRDKKIAIGRLIISILLFILGAILYFATPQHKELGAPIIAMIFGYWLR